MTANKPPAMHISYPPAGGPSTSPGPRVRALRGPRMNSCRGQESARLSRRSLFEGAAAILTGIAAAAVPAARGEAVAATKISQTAAQYQDHPKGAQHCSICVHFVSPSACQLVAGKISPNGWCVLFAAKSSG
jgi:hypothetical protein